MRKIYQSAPDVPQSAANKAIDIIERHFTASGVRRAEELPEESKIHLLRELQRFLLSDSGSAQGKENGGGHSWGLRQGGGFLGAVFRRLVRGIHFGGHST